jgi:tetratricopeptide (TPR) repeat protein
MTWPRLVSWLRLVSAFSFAFMTISPVLADAPKALPKTLEMTKLTPAKLFPNLCVIKYRVSTASPECQAFFDQGLGYFYSYVWMEAARSFETAAHYDPNCAMAWWALSRAIESWGRGQHTAALKKAQDLLPTTSHRESLLIKARLQEKGMWPGVTADARTKSAAKTLDELLTLHDDDEEGWFYRAKVSGGGVSAVPYYKALLRVNPLHAGAHHELVHFYEGFRRPALGWPHAEKYMESSPGIPHAFHMQAHLATRLGRWAKTTDWSARAIELQRAYHKEMGVQPSEDWQYAHHLEVLTLSLIHDGRFHEARAIKKLTQDAGLRLEIPWFRLHLAERDWEEALRIARQMKKGDKVTASYLAALVHLKKGDSERAASEVDVLQEAYLTRRNERQLELRLWETQGMLLSERGEAEAGLKLLAKAVARTKDDYHYHSWGNGAYYMEAWGIAALQAGKLDTAEEAFLETLAHDTGSARGALGMQVLCERQGRSEEAGRFADLAQRCWRRADLGCLPQELAALRHEFPSLPVDAPVRQPSANR